MNSEHVEVLHRYREWRRSGGADLSPDPPRDVDAAMDAAIASLSAQQPADCVGCEGNPAPENIPCAVCGQQPAADGGFTAADMMDARQEGRKEAQQPAACVACEGAPGFENSPCAVCGQQPAAVDVADSQAAEIERLRAEVAEWKASYQQAADGQAAHADRAERLADALREAMEWNWIDGDVPDAIQVKARAALREHDQEGGNP